MSAAPPDMLGPDDGDPARRAALRVSKSRLPPGPRAPRALQTLAYALGQPRFLERCRDRYGDLFTLELVARMILQERDQSTWVFLADPEHVKQVFTGDPGMLRAGEANRANPIMAQTVGSRSILLLDEPWHMTERKLMLPSFHGERVQRYGELIAAVARSEVERWPEGKAFALWPRMQAITLEVIVRAVFGVSGSEQVERLSGLLRVMLNAGTSGRELAMFMLFGRRYSRGAFRRLVQPVSDALVGEIRKRRAATDLAARHDICSLLVRARYEDSSGLTDEQLRDELITLLIAGHESTATELAWAFERLLRHPEKLERLREEALAGRHEYADAVVRETLRVRPVLPFVLRRLAAPIEVGGYQLPAGISVAPCIYLIHLREDLYPQARRFLPERFLDQPPGTYTWFPFGGGVRRCLGASFAQLEMRQVLQTVAVSAELRPDRLASESVRRRFITLAPARGASAVLVRRRNRLGPHAVAPAPAAHDAAPKP